jgi:hypothetical protein
MPDWLQPVALTALVMTMAMVWWASRSQRRSSQHRVVMRLAACGIGLLAVLLTVSPIVAHHQPGHSGGPPWLRATADQTKAHLGGPPWKRPTDGTSQDSHSGPPAGAPGNSGAAHWCQGHFNDSQAARQFASRGECVASFADLRHAKKDPDTKEDNDDGGGTTTGQP